MMATATGRAAGATVAVTPAQAGRLGPCLPPDRLDDRSQAANGSIVSEEQVRLESDGQRHGSVVGAAHAGGKDSRAVDTFHADRRQEPMQFIRLGRVDRACQHLVSNLLRHDDVASQDAINQGKPPDLAQKYQRTCIGNEGQSCCRSAARSSGP